MRNTTRLGLILVGISLLLGLGLYIQYQDKVNAFVRSLGRKPLGADEVLLTRRTTADLPGLEGNVRVRVDDIKIGKTADVQIIGPDTEILATRTAARVGDRLAFTHDGKCYEVEVMQYIDKIGDGDTARIRLNFLGQDVPPEQDGAAPKKKDAD